MATNVSQLVQALDALEARVDAAATGSNGEGLRMFKALVNMVKNGIVLQDNACSGASGSTAAATAADAAAVSVVGEQVTK